MKETSGKRADDYIRKTGKEDEDLRQRERLEGCVRRERVKWKLTCKDRNEN